MLDVEIFLMTALGVVVSIVLPILRAQLPGSQARKSGTPFWEVSRPYLIIGLFSILASVLLLSANPDLTCQTALLAGYAWDSTIQKIAERN